MAPDQSLEDCKSVIVALLHDVYQTSGDVSNIRSLSQTLKKVEARLRAEGTSFLTKTCPKLGKAFDRALAGGPKMNCTDLRLKRMKGTELPSFLGELFIKVFLPTGDVRQQPDVTCVTRIRQLLFVFYKYEFPSSDEQKQAVVSKFEQTENDLSTLSEKLGAIRASLEVSYGYRRRRFKAPMDEVTVAREARILLSGVFSGFDPADIYPRHGPGAVATKQRLSDKYQWTNVSARITACYPFDEYFCSSAGHVCDTYDNFRVVGDRDLPARVILVPKDSRGPRLISCEPVDFQWVQQGLGRAIVELVEAHPSTRDHVHFTDQRFNRWAALRGSRDGAYSTLDLNEASDRVSVDLVRLLYPENVFTYLNACRSSSTVLPDGRELELRKFAPMGSSLCFPILALTVWALLAAGSPDADTRERILVYGDDVVVPTTYVADATRILESFGLKINRDKSCTSGLFRESCGMDAFQGTDVTPIRLRTVWSSSRSPNTYTSWIAYANSFFSRGYYRTYDLIVGWLHSVYGCIPDVEMGLPVPSLLMVPEHMRPTRRRFNKKLQKLEWKVLDVRAKTISYLKDSLDGWSMLLRYFAENVGRPNAVSSTYAPPADLFYMSRRAFSVSSYTDRDSGMLESRWR